jgi:hypothetical protein
MCYMKSVLMGIVFILSFCSVQAQSQIAYYLEQIAALKVYDEILVKGYGIVRDGLQVINDLKHGDFDLHQHYFNSLKEINSTIRQHYTNADDVYNNIVKECTAIHSLVNNSPLSQKDYVQLVVRALKTRAKESQHQYALLITPGNYQLADDQRMQQINRVIQELANEYAFIQKFHHALQVMILQEQKESGDIDTIDHLYQP